MQFELTVRREKAGAATQELPPTMFFSMSTTLSPLRRNSAAALTPLNPPPTMSTSHLIALVRGGQYLWWFTNRVVRHEF